MGRAFLDITMWVIVGAALVLIIKNPNGFSKDVTSAGGFVQGETSILTGTNYKGGN